MSEIYEIVENISDLMNAVKHAQAIHQQCQEDLLRAKREEIRAVEKLTAAVAQINGRNLSQYQPLVAV